MAGIRYFVVLALVCAVICSSSAQPQQKGQGRLNNPCLELNSNKHVPCGGIAGFSCPDGCRCKYYGTFPDAGGKCVGNDRP